MTKIIRVTCVKFRKTALNFTLIDIEPNQRTPLVLAGDVMNLFLQYVEKECNPNVRFDSVNYTDFKLEFGF